jgi:hypothetical protein
VAKSWSHRTATQNEKASPANINSTKNTTTTIGEHNPNPGPKMIEISYSFRGYTDSDFLAQLQAGELPLLIQPCSNPIGVSFLLIEERETRLPENAQLQTQTLAARTTPAQTKTAAPLAPKTTKTKRKP